MTSASGNTDYSDLVQQFCSVTGEGDSRICICICSKSIRIPARINIERWIFLEHSIFRPKSSTTLVIIAQNMENMYILHRAYATMSVSVCLCIVKGVDLTGLLYRSLFTNITW